MDYRQQDNPGDRQSPYGGQPGTSGGRQAGGTQLSTAQPVPETASATMSPENANSGGIAYVIAAAVVVALMLLVMATSFLFSRYIQEVLDSGDPILEQPFPQIYEEYSGSSLSEAGLDTGTIEG